MPIFQEIQPRISAEELSKILGVSRATICRWARHGGVLPPCVRVGARFFWPAEAVKSFCDNLDAQARQPVLNRCHECGHYETRLNRGNRKIAWCGYLNRLTAKNGPACPQFKGAGHEAD